MSIHATLDLRAKASPRSLCVFDASETTNPLLTGAAAAASSNNPFDTKPQPVQEAMAVIAGTERGSLHYRTYALPASTTSSGLSSSLALTASSGGASATTTSSSSSSAAASKAQAPLGLGAPKMSSPRGSASPPLPREYFPVDLTSLPGAVVACIQLGSNNTHPNSSAATTMSTAVPFLLLLDDNRGSGSSSSGHYASLLVTLQGGSFHVVPTSAAAPTQQPLPSRMSTAIYSAAAGGLVYATGRSVVCWGTAAGLEAATAGGGGASSTAGGTRGASTTRKQQQAPPPPRLWFGHNVLPAPGVRAGPDAICLTAGGRVAVVAVGNSFHAVAGQPLVDERSNLVGTGSNTAGGGTSSNNNLTTDCVKLLAFGQSSQVHPAICLDLPAADHDSHPDWSLVFLASGRDCAAVDVYYGPAASPALAYTHTPRAVVSLPSPILAACPAGRAGRLVAVLTSDGLLSIRSPSCLAIGLRTVEVGQRPNDFFVLRTLPPPPSSNMNKIDCPWIVALSFSAQAKVLQAGPDTAQNLADRLIRHAIDAFGANGFPRSELAAAVNASFTATSYVGPEASPHARNLLKQYLEAVLGLADFESGGSSGWPTEFSTSATTSSTATGSGQQQLAAPTFGTATSGRQQQQQASGWRSTAAGGGNSSSSSSMVASLPAAHVMAGTALLCLACHQLTPPNSGLACRAAKACAMGRVVFASDVPTAAAAVCEMIAEQLLREASSKFSLLSSPAPPIVSSHRSQAALYADFVEAAIWLLRSAGKHERAIEVAHDRLLMHAPTSSSSQTAADGSSTAGGGATTSFSGGGGRGLWSRIKYESYTATHLSEIWGSARDEGYTLVLQSPATYRLLENNPRLGLSVFTASHPQNEMQWRACLAGAQDDPLAQAQYAYDVLKLLKSINPALPYDKEKTASSAQDHHHHGTSSNTGGPDGAGSLPLESGRALAVLFLESAIGITTGRPTQDEFDTLAGGVVDEALEQHLANFHDELSFLLLEGVIAERRDDSSQEEDTPLGKIYRFKLRQLLRWPLAKVRPQRFMETLPASFLQEKALILGRVGRHEDALRILYRDLNSLDLALEYCDNRYERQKVLQEERRGGGGSSSSIQHQQWMPSSGGSDDHSPSGGLYSPSQQQGGVLGGEEDNAYLPLVRVALADSEDTERGITAAIQVLALRRGAIDRAAALRLLPSGVPVSAVARPFLIPALVDSESQVRRLTVVSALLRARYLRLKEELTVAQLKAQANLHVVSQFRSIDMGELVQSSKAFRVRTSTAASSTMPDLMVVKHFFPKHLVIQAKVTNTTGVGGGVGLGAGSSGLGVGAGSSAADFSIAGGVSSNQMGRILSDIAFVVAESSEEAIQPMLFVPIKLLPVQMTGSAWCVLDADPSHMDGATAQLTCELRYTVQPVDFSGSRSVLTSPAATSLGRAFVEELQDLEVHAAHFS